MSTFSLSYLDFLPQCLKAGGFVSLPEFERFDVLIGRANEWFAQNPGIKIKVCETIDLPYRCYGPDSKNRPDVDNDWSIFHEGGNVSNCYVKALRIWILPKGPQDDQNPVRLGYLNVTPACIDAGGFFTTPKFDDFNVTLTKFNEILRQQPLNGYIINTETLDIKFATWGEGSDPDLTFFFESGKAPTCFLTILRVFYVGAAPARESIGCVDIVPKVTRSGFNMTGEPFGEICRRANTWIAQNNGVRVTNVQSINYKLDYSLFGSKDQHIDTMRSFFYKAGKGVTIFVRMVRICYAIPEDRSLLQGIQPPQLTYRNFVPALVRPPGGGLVFNPKYELVTQNMKRVSAWLDHTGARVVDAETVRMILNRGGFDPDDTVTFDRGNAPDVWLTFIRVYLDGYYQDPPVEVLPPPPPQEEAETACCTVL